MNKPYSFFPKKLLRYGLFTALAFFLTINLQAQIGPLKVWDYTFGGSEGDRLNILQQTTDGGYILGGYSYSGISGDKTQANKGPVTTSDYWIVKLDANGNKTWDKTFGGSSGDALFSLQQTSDGGYILGGNSISGISGDKTQASKGGVDFWIIKLDANGNKIWDKTIGGNSGESLQTLQQTSDGGYIVGGSTYSGIGGDKTQAIKGDSDYWVVKLNASGNKLWDKAFGGNGEERFYSLQQTSDGGYCLAGTSTTGINGDKTQANKGSYDYWVLKINANGNKLWDKTFGGSDEDKVSSIKQTTDGGFILGGHSKSPISGDKTQGNNGISYTDDYWVVKLDGTGNKLWDKTLGGNNDDEFYSMQLTPDGGYILGGFSYSGISSDKSEINNGNADFWVVRLDANGIRLWDKTLGGSAYDELTSLVQTPNGDYILGGLSGSGISGDKTQASKGNVDYWVAKLNPSCNDLTATLTPSCGSGGTNLNVNVTGLQASITGPLPWTLTYKVNGVSQTATGTTPTFMLAQNVTSTTVYSLVSIASGACTTNLTNSITVDPIPSTPVVTPGNNCGPGSVTLSATGAPTNSNYIWYNTATNGTPLYSNSSGTFTTPILSATTTYYVAASNNVGCEGPRTPVTATIHQLPVVYAGPAQTVCSNDAPLQLSGFSPAGGIWSGSGVNAAGVFTPDNSLIGNQLLTYTVTQNGCFVSNTLTLTVKASPVVTFGANVSVCASAAPIQLTGFNPAGGTWSGLGVNASGLFTPDVSLIGIQTLTYSVTQNGCTTSATKTITVTATPMVTTGPAQTICANAAPLQITGFSPVGGNWSGPGVSSTGLFTPATSLAGNQTLIYAYTTNGCTVTAPLQITVTPFPMQPVVTLNAPDTLISSVISNSYEWTFNATTLPNNTRKLKATAAGIYAVRVKDTNNCSSAFSPDYNFVVSGTKEALTTGIDLYPNPSTGIVNLVLKGQPTVQVTVFNSIGQVVLRKAVAKADDNEAVQLNLSNVAKGIYMVQVRTEKQVIIKKIVVE